MIELYSYVMFFFLMYLIQSAKTFAKHGFEITTFDTRSSSEAIGNAKLLREEGTRFETPSELKSRKPWDSLAGAQGVNIGSGVKHGVSSTSWRPKYTSY